MVEPKEFLKDMVNFQKKSFEKSYTIMENIKGESEKMVNTFIDTSFDATKDMYSQYLDRLMKEKDNSED